VHETLTLNSEFESALIRQGFADQDCIAQTVGHGLERETIWAPKVVEHPRGAGTQRGPAALRFHTQGPGPTDRGVQGLRDWAKGRSPGKRDVVARVVAPKY